MKLRRPRARTWVWIFVILAVMAWIYGPGLAKVMDLKQQEVSVGQEVQALEAENAQLSEKIERLENDPLYVENEVRRKLGLSRPNETIYKVIGPEELRRTRIE